MANKILVVMSHPNPTSYVKEVAEAYIHGAQDAGFECTLADLYREGFDPVMSERDMQQFDGVPMPDDVLREQARIEQHDAICFGVPHWVVGHASDVKRMAGPRLVIRLGLYVGI